jgi:hypothetical protein
MAIGVIDADGSDCIRLPTAMQKLIPYVGGESRKT